MSGGSTVDDLIERVQPELAATRRAPLELDEVEAAARLQGVLFGNDADEPPLKIDRYAVVGRLGRGGMGVVFAARDEQLDRTVALKLLRQKEGTVDPRRLRREARALAQLTHPNIVEVYDVGVHTAPGGRTEVHVVLEYVDGRQLDRFLHEDKPAWRQVLDVLIGAGEGLSAAHRAGVIHRDFKPSNVLVDAKGHARVLDFGLAASPESRSDEQSGEPDVPVGDRLTVTGAVLGTPSYMAPEQHLGQTMDERTDQYSFCVALYEALWGARPFSGESAHALLDSKRGGPPPRPPAADATPRALYDAIARGLRVEPHERWPSMDALLDRLRKLRRRRSGLWIGGAALLGGLGLAVAVTSSEQELDPCDADDAKTMRAQLGRAWSDDAQADVAAAFSAADPHAAATTLERTEPALDDYVVRWTTAFDTWCDASDDQTLNRDRELSCLRADLEAFAGLVGVFTRADTPVVRNAVAAVASLPAPDRCTDEAIASRALPQDPSHAGEYAEIRSDLARAHAENAAGHADAARQILAEVQPRVDALGESRLQYMLLAADGAVMRSTAEYRDAVELFERAYHLASAAGDDDFALRCVDDLMFLWAHRLEAQDHAQTWARHGEAMLQRGALPDTARAAFLSVRGLVYHRGGHFEDAQAALEEALAIGRAQERPDRLSASFDLEILSAVLRAQGDLKGGVRVMEEARDARLSAVGPDHPDYAQAIYNLGVVYAEVGNVDEGLQHLEAAKALRQRLLPSSHPDVIDSLNSIATLLVGKRDFAGAKATYAEARRLADDGTANRGWRMALTGLGVCARHLEEYDEALRLYREVAAAAERAEAPIEVANALGNIGNVLFEQGEQDQAIAEFEAARTVANNRLGPQHPKVAEFDEVLARALLAAGRVAQARRVFARALQAVDAAGDHARVRKFKLGGGVDLLLHAGRRDAAVAEVTAVRAEALAAGEAHNVAHADALLADRLAAP